MTRESGTAVHDEVQLSLTSAKLAELKQQLGRWTTPPITHRLFERMFVDRASAFSSSIGAHLPYSIYNLSDEDQHWAVAFYEVLGVGVEFFANTNGMRRKYLREHYTALAEHKSSKGRKAKRIYEKVVTAQVLARLAPPEEVLFPHIDQKVKAAAELQANSLMSEYCKMHPNIVKHWNKP